MGDLLVEWGALVHEELDFCGRVFGVEERAIAVFAGAFEDHFDRRAEPHDIPELFEQRTISLAADDATAGGNDASLAACVIGDFP